ncbi:sugar ABC transporter ATP-binding protein [Desulfosediminicola flagellatus]|uniref:sugar ABC transporter ATP-binding protein n=1 Tax=Desulfosediminicola flagellatus TaxID=2569541 RepID=UPI0010AC6CBC|nr:sugar ABC transporter ATP-binding protein [Desulfosediminicola flagellatus]
MSTDRTQTTPLLEVRNITKEFPGVRALDGVQLRVNPGEVLALLGENGAGKSTLVKILTGVYQPTSGKILRNGQQVSYHSAQEAWGDGIAAIHQETIMFSELSVTENIFMGHQVVKNNGLLDWKRMHSETGDLLKRLDIVDFTPQTPLKDLSVAQKHLVEVAKALSHDARILIMDEPTAALSQKEVDELFLIVRKLRDEGTGILFISHRFDDIFSISDTFVVFRDGAFVGEGEIAGVNEDELVHMMAGRPVENEYRSRTTVTGEPLLSVNNLCHPTEFKDISFDLRKGEVLGFYGLVGSGRSELMHAIFGLTRPSSGNITLDGEDFYPKTAEDAISKGVAYVPEDRQQSGAILAMSVRDNITLTSLPEISGGLRLNPEKENSFARRYASRLKLKAHSLAQLVGELSGGNQQKVVIGKWLGSEPRIIILDEPTKGIDVGAKAMLHNFIAELVESGLSVIMVSSDLPEVMGLSDRIVVMREGLIRATLVAKETNQEQVVALATGLK